MANYTRTTWVEGGAPGISATQLNRIETGICESRWYGTTSNSGNNYSIALDPAPSAYYEGMTVRTKINAQNTGAVTLNCNALGVKACKLPNGNDIPSGKLKANSIVTWVYNGTYFFLQGSDSAGTATAADVKTGKTFSNDTGSDIPGAMPVNASQTATVEITGSAKPTKVVPAGYTPGGTITAQLAVALASVIKSGNNVGGVDGTYSTGITVGDTAILTDSTYASAYETTWKRARGWRINIDGSYRFKGCLTWSAGAGIVYAQVRKNGTVLQEYYTDSHLDFTLDIVNASKNDLIEVYIRSGNGAACANFANPDPTRICTALPTITTVP